MHSCARPLSRRALRKCGTRESSALQRSRESEPMAEPSAPVGEPTTISNGAADADAARERGDERGGSPAYVAGSLAWSGSGHRHETFVLRGHRPGSRSGPAAAGSFTEPCMRAGRGVHFARVDCTRRAARVEHRGASSQSEILRGDERHGGRFFRLRMRRGVDGSVPPNGIRVLSPAPSRRSRAVEVFAWAQSETLRGDERHEGELFRSRRACTRRERAVAGRHRADPRVGA